MDRFTKAASEPNIEEFINKSKNTNTTKSTNLWMRVYESWAEIRGANLKIETLSPEELDITLQSFYSEVKRKDGKDYEPNSLANMQAGIERYLKENGYVFSIIRDRKFATSQAVLEGKARFLREQGKGKRPNKASSLTSIEEEKLWECGQLGASTPLSLVNTIWLQLTQHFGLRGRQEHHTMKVEHFTLKKDDKGVEFLTFAEGITKTRQSGLHEKHRLVQPKMFATKNTRCPIYFYKLFLSKRPLSLRSSGPMYLSIIYNPTSSVWYKNMPMGQNTINEIMKRMVSNSSLATSTKKLTNHSARKTVIKKLKQNKVPKSDIIGITGHSTEAGLDAYDSGDEDEQQVISNAIDCNPHQNKQIVTTNSNASSNWVVPADSPLFKNPSFNFFDKQFWNTPSSSNFNFNNCTVNFYDKAPKSVSKKRKRCIIYSSSDSSQE